MGNGAGGIGDAEDGEVVVDVRGEAFGDGQDFSVVIHDDEVREFLVRADDVPVGDDDAGCDGEAGAVFVVVFVVEGHDDDGALLEACGECWGVEDGKRGSGWREGAGGE